MSTQPVSTGMKVVFAIVTLFWGWLFAIMIPSNTPIGRNWAISLPRKTSEAEATAYWLDGTGMRVGQRPVNQIAMANLPPGTPDHPVMPSEGKAIAGSSNRNDSTDGTRDSYVLFEPNAKSNAGSNSTKPSPLTETEQIKNYGNDSKKLAPQESTVNSEVWEVQGKSLERKLQDKQWQTEVQMPKIALPEFKNTPPPRWSDEIAKSISQPAESSGQKRDIPKEKLVITPKPSVELAQSDSQRDQTGIKPKTDHKEKQSKNQNPAKSEPKPEPKSESGEQAVVARPVDPPPVQKAETTVVDSKPKTEDHSNFTPYTTSVPVDKPVVLDLNAIGSIPQKKEDKPDSTPYTTSSPVDKPVVLELKAVGTIQPERRPAVTGQLTINESANGTEMAKLPSEDTNAFYAKSGQMEAVNLIPSRYNQDNYQIRGTDYSTVVPQTVQRQPGPVTASTQDSAKRTETVMVNREKTVSSSTAPSISAVTTYRPDTALTPSEVAKYKNMSQSQYERFLRNNSGKLDSTGRFPAKTLLLIPE